MPSQLRKSPSERVTIFIVKQIGSFREFENGVAEVTPGHLMSGFFEHTLEARTQFLQPLLERSRAKAQILRYVVNNGPVAVSFC